MRLFDNDQEFGFQQSRLEDCLSNILVIVHSLIIIIAIFGNSLVIYMVLSNTKLRNVRNSFMVNLTFSNLLLATICAPWFLVSQKYPNIVIGDLWCKISHTIPVVVILVSAFSIMMISIDRCMFIVFARSRQLNSRDVAIIIMLIWLLAICLSMPVFSHRYILDTSKNLEIFTDVIKMSNLMTDEAANAESLSFLNNNNSSQLNNHNEFNNNILNNASNSTFLSSSNNELTIDTILDFENNNNYKRIYCVENWENPAHKKFYVLVLFSLEFVLPCVCMLITYIWIIRFLKAQHTRMSHHEILRKKLIQKEKPHQKNCKLLTALCLTFIICCLPLSLFNIVTDIIINTIHDSQQEIVYSPLKVLTTLELLNAAISPLLYGLMNYNFRIEINEKIKLLKKKYHTVDTFEAKSDEIKLQYPLKFYKANLI